MSLLQRSRALSTAALLAALLCPTFSFGVNFNLVYRGPGSASPDPSATAPSFDPSGTLLAAQMQEAANEWSDIVEDSHTMTINYFYAGIGEVPTETANAATTSSIAVGTPFPNRTTVGEIKFFDGQVAGIYDWYFDPFPQNDSEFAMGQTLFGSLTPAEKSTGFNTSVVGSPQLEVGHRGVASSGLASTGFDALSVARHEIGHLMGVTNSGQLLAAGDETLDGDYDFNPTFVGGATIAAKVSNDNEGGTSIAHLDSTFPVMSGTGTAVGTRFDITATDVFAAAAVGNWTQIDLKRQDYVRFNANFHDPANWAGNQVPGPSDIAAIRHGGNVVMALNDVVGSFLLAEGSTLATGPNNLVAQADAVIGPTTGIGTARLTVSNGGLFAADEILIDDATVAVAGGILSAPQGDITNEGRLEGNGTVRFDGLLRNSGTLEAAGGTLVIEEAISGSGARIDLDGLPSGSGVVRAVTGSLDINVALQFASFTGQMTVGPGRFIEVDDELRLQDGSLTLDGSGSQTATFRGPLLDVNRTLIADRRAAIDGNVEVSGLGDVQVPQSNDTLTVTGDLTMIGGDVTGAGTLVVQNRLNAGFGTIDVGELTLQGDAVIQGASVTAGTIDTDDVIGMSGGTLAFGKLTGKVEQSGGEIVVGQSLLNGTLTQNNSAELSFEIGGPGDFSQLTVSDSILLDGSILVSLTNGYDPVGGEQFPIILAGELDIDSLMLGGPDADRFNLDINGDTLSLEALAAVTLAADFNGDGVVDLLDLDILGANFGQASTMASGDANGDGVTDLLDLDILGATFGVTAAVSVPEPTGLALVLAALVGSWRSRRPLID